MSRARFAKCSNKPRYFVKIQHHPHLDPWILQTRFSFEIPCPKTLTSIHHELLRVQAYELEQMVMRYPPILLHDMEDLIAKMRFLKGFIKRPPSTGRHRMGGDGGIWGGIVTFPTYFNADLANYIGEWY